MTFYAAHNTRADLDNGNHGFRNTWEVSRFETKADRDEFVSKRTNQLAKAVTRRAAEGIFRDHYDCTGETMPSGGLFGTDAYGQSRFWNENAIEEIA